MYKEPHPLIINKCQLVRETCQKVSQQAAHVRIVQEPIKKLIEQFRYTPFNQFEHHQTSSQDDEKILLYLFVLDSLNFCFWPLEGFEYDRLAGSVKKSIEENEMNLQTLKYIDENGVKEKIFGGVDVPLVTERARILREMATVVLNAFSGSFINIITQANKSAVKMLEILTQNFPNFQDHSIYRGRQVHFYKRSQILIGDIWARYQGKSVGEFLDIEQLTMFPDYRVPQILNEHGILVYSEELQKMINSKAQIDSGSRMELEIRAASVVAVEMMKMELLNNGKKVNSIEIDWFLWELGEVNLGKIVNHHRTLTIYY